MGFMTRRGRARWEAMGLSFLGAVTRLPTDGRGRVGAGSQTLLGERRCVHEGHEEGQRQKRRVEPKGSSTNFGVGLEKYGSRFCDPPSRGTPRPSGRSPDNREVTEKDSRPRGCTVQDVSGSTTVSMTL